MKSKQNRIEKTKSFEDLWIWQQAREFLKLIYKDFEKGSPGHKDYVFRTELCKTGISVMNNIAQGFERDSDREFSRFLI